MGGGQTEGAVAIENGLAKRLAELLNAWFKAW